MEANDEGLTEGRKGDDWRERGREEGSLEKVVAEARVGDRNLEGNRVGEGNGNVEDPTEGEGETDG